MSDPHPDGDGGGLQLPFDPATLAVGVVRRVWIVALCGVLGGIAGVLAALKLGKQEFEARTVLLYKAPPAVPAGARRRPLYEPPSLNTLLDMVKLDETLQEVRERLKLAPKISAIGGAVDVSLQRKTTLMTMRVRWDNPLKAASIANTVRDVFLERLRTMRREEVGAKLKVLDVRLAAVQAELTKADSALREFTTRHRVIDLTGKAQSTIVELAAVDEGLRQGELRQRVLVLQQRRTDVEIAKLHQQVGDEKTKSRGQKEALANMNIRLQRLRQSISRDKHVKVTTAEYAAREVAYERAKALHAEGLLSEALLESARLAWEKARIAAIDSPQVQAWRAEIAKLDAQVVPSDDAATPSTAILVEMQRKKFAQQMEQLEVEQRVLQLMARREVLQRRLGGLPKLQREHIDLRRASKAAEMQLAELQSLHGRAMRAHTSKATGFTVIAVAIPKFRPRKSNRKLIAIAVIGLFLALGGALLVLLELLDLCVRSGPELALQGAPLLASFARGNGPLEDQERMRKAVHQLRRQLPDGGARLLVVTPGHQRESSEVVTALASGFVAGGKRVLVIDADVRADGSSRGLVEALADGERTTKQALARMVRAELDRGFDRLDSGRAGAVELLAGEALTYLLAQASEVYDVVLIEGPAAGDTVDIEMLADRADGAVLVAAYRRTRRAAVRATAKRLTAAGGTLAGAILVGTRSLYRRL